MKTKFAAGSGIALFALLSLLASAAAQGASFRLDDYPEYCKRFDISGYCSEEAFNQMLADTASGSLPEPFVNELAYLGGKVYDGDLMIEGVEAKVDIDENRATVAARYVVANRGADRVRANFMALQAPPNVLSVEEDGEWVETDDLARWSSEFAAGQEKAISIEYSDLVGENIYGYNVNLLIDTMVPSGQLADGGDFGITLPSGAAIKECAPSGYSTSEAGGRITVKWTKSDFAPWTNPFNDLVCTWEYKAAAEEAPATTGAQAETAPTATTSTAPEAGGGQNYAVWILLLAIAVVILLMVASSVKGKGGKRSVAKKGKTKK